MEVRKTTHQDLPRILEIYAHAREQMRRTGNPTQWGDSYPARETLEDDIQRGVSYVLEEGGDLAGVFMFTLGDDPTYQLIEEGAWLNDGPYGTIHRLASGGTAPGVFRACARFCETLAPNLRADTHADNLIMQHLLESWGFRRCGRIYAEDGTPRIAYLKPVRPY